MKIRKEKSGIHIFDRQTGMHFLFDEVQINTNEYMISPRTVSLALTTRCNLNCEFCYAEKSAKDADIIFLKQICQKLDDLGVLEITLGGGEPFVYPHLVEFCQWVWRNTSLGINITTNGTLINSEHVQQLKNSISSIRISIEAIEEEYNNIRKSSFEKIKESLLLLKNNIPTSINCTVLKNKVHNLEKVINFAIENHINDVLIIAEHDKGKIILSDKELKQIDSIIQKYKTKIQLNVTEGLANLLSVDILPDECSQEFSFSHLSVDKKIKRNSYDKYGVTVENLDMLKDIFIKQHEKI